MNISELAGNETTMKPEEVLKDGLEVETEEEIQPEKSSFNWSALHDFLFKPTGPGPISEYKDHPLNFNQSNGLAQILRGLTGLFTDLGYALVDIVVGGYRWAHENKGE
jgi:hypothetical protein